MQNAETVLSIIRNRGKQGLPLNNIYRQLFNPDLYLKAYARIYRNSGAMTPGATQETADGMSLAKIKAIIEAVRYERYRWTPVRRTYIEKKHSAKLRPLGLPTWSDKLLQEVIRSILEAYYEPQFSKHSHGFRPELGCHTALREIHHTWKGTNWFIEGDISQCFDSLSHEVLMSALGEKIHDNRVLRLIENLLKAGYLEEWKLNKTLSGTPQGGICSPILANIYLDRLDKFVETVLFAKYNRGVARKENPEYKRLRSQSSRAARLGNRGEARQLRRKTQQIPSIDATDPNYRRLRYVRYADDFLLGFSGPRCEAEEIKQELREFLARTLKLQLSETKTLITHARTQAARFLGYEVIVISKDHKHDKTGRRSINGQIGLKVPATVIREKCQPYMRQGKPKTRPERLNDTDYSIVAQYQQEFRGIAEYYQLAYNRHTLNKLEWVMARSLARTLAQKHKSSVKQVIRRYTTTVQGDKGPTKVLQVRVEREGRKPLIAQWGGISLARCTDAILHDQPTRVWNPGTELLQRLLAETCELCGSQENIEVHHIRALKDLTRAGRKEKPAWARIMAARQRKTLVVCQTCHHGIQYRQPRRHDKAE